MAESKKPSGGKTKKTAAETRAEAAEALRQAAELIASLNAEAQANTATKKSTAKKPATKKPATKKPAPKKVAEKPAEEQPAEEKPTEKPAAKKPAAKSAAAKSTTAKSTAKKPAAKKPATKKPAEKPADPVPVEEPAAVQPEPAPEPIPEPEPVPVEEPVAVQPEPEPVPVEEPVAVQPEPAPEPIPEPEPAPVEEPAPEPVIVRQEVAAQEQQPVAAKKSSKVLDKGRLPLFIIANVLLVVAAVLLIVTAFDISYLNPLTGKTESEWYTLFGYFSHGEDIKYAFSCMAGSWGNGGYTLVGILMVLAFLVPLALVIKNVVMLIVKKDKNIHALDAIISFAFMLAYLGLVNLYGANMTAGHLIALAVSVILIAFTVFVRYLQCENAKFPVFSIVNIALAIVCLFLLTATPVATLNIPGMISKDVYAGYAAGETGAASVGFIMLVLSVLVLALLMIMQLKKLPSLFEIIVPAALFVLALVAVITMGAGKPDDTSIGGGFVAGCAITMVLALVNVLFALIGKLKGVKVTIADLEPAAAATVEDEAYAQPAQEYTATENIEQPEVQPEQQTANAKVCPSCGMENEPDSVYCFKCGRKL